eukprot:3347864-Amphidinium_carterae.1
MTVASKLRTKCQGKKNNLNTMKCLWLCVWFKAELSSEGPVCIRGKSMMQELGAGGVPAATAAPTATPPAGTGQ